jgi:hypothetical protein
LRFYPYCLIALITTPSSLFANEYPTQDIVRHVVDCMAKNGGQTEENLYVCTCRFDVIKSAVTFENYESVLVYLRNKAMLGEKGRVFRDLSVKTQELVNNYAEIEVDALNKCPIVKQVTRRKKGK